jgi:hypothetical protein
MRTRGKCRIGAALIFTAALVGCSQSKRPTAHFDLAPTDNGATGFYLLLGPDAWRAVTDHKGRGWTDELLDGSVHAQINALVEQGLREKHVECGRHWLMSEIRPLVDGGIVFSGYCASEAELRAARRIVVHWDGET